MAFIIGGTVGAIVGAGAIGAAGNIAGAAISSGAASSAADQQAAAAREANQQQQQQYEETKKLQAEAAAQGRADLDPWRTAGTGALSKMGDQDFQRDFGASDFQQDPGYQFRMAEGQKALERSAAARGGLQSGGTLKALTKYGQGVASEEYGNAYNRFNSDRDRRFGRLSSMSGAGLTAAGGMANASAGHANAVGAAGQNYANNVGANTMGAANAAGAAGMASANAWGGALSGIGQSAMDGVAMNQQSSWMERVMKARGV